MALVAFGAFVVLAPLGAKAESPVRGDPVRSDSCESAAKQVLRLVEALPMEGRATRIAQAFVGEKELGCGVFAESFWEKIPPLPVGCTMERAESCRFEGGLEVAPRAAQDVGAERYVRIQSAAVALRKAGKLSAAHERLLLTWLLSAALEGERNRAHPSR